MTDNDDPPGDEPDRPREGPPDDRDDGRPNEKRFTPARSGERSDGWLSSLLGALEGLEELSQSGRKRGDRSTLDYTVSIQSGFEDLGREESGPGTPSGRSPETGRPRTRRKRIGGPRKRVTTRTHEDELLVVADIGETDPEDVVVGFDGATLVIGVGDRELERVHLPWEETTADATVHNGILTVTVEPRGDTHE
ncbi:gas vesicle protein GvpH [Natrialbaceae archaeon A-gly3]